VSAAGERALIEALASGKGVLHTADPSIIEDMSPDPDDDKFPECALELGVEFVVSGGSDLLELGAYTRIPILASRELLAQVGEAPEE
jgi:predicted nucleic acid-binding protein